MFSASTFSRLCKSARALFRSPILGLFCALTLTLGSASAAVTVIRVDANSLAANPNGASWSSAYANLQTAIAVAGPTAENPVEIWVKTGLYRPTTDTNRSVAFNLKSYMTIRGGFAGTESSINDRPSIATSSTYTVLSGDIGNNQPDRIQPNNQVNDPSIINYDADQANAKDNSYNVIRAIGVSNAALERVVVAGGYASDPAVTGPQIETMLQPSTTDNAAGFREQVKAGACGGGLFSQDSRIVIAHSWFVGNYASGPGGAIMISRGYINLDDTKVIRNFSAYAGGGVFLQGATLQNISNNTFYGNISAFLAGGLLIQAETSTNEVKSYEGGLLTSLAGLTYDTPSLIPPGTEGAKTPGFDLAKTKKLAKSLAKTIAEQLKKRATAKAAQAGVSIGSSAASSAASSATSALGSAYTGITFLVTAIDLGVQIAMLLGVDPNDPFIKGWTAFSTVFNAYFTPSGLAMTLYNLVFPTKTPSLLDRLATFRRSEIASKHNQDPALTMSYNRFEKNYSAGLGGGLVILRANVNVAHSWFVENSSLCGGSAAAFFCYNTTNIESSAFVRNTSVYGDAITFGFRNISRLIQNTIVKNHSASVNGHAIGADAGADVSILNTVLWGNTSGDINDTNNVNRFGGADLFATRKDDLDADGLESYNNAGDAHSIYTAIIDIQNSDIQGLDRLVTGSTLFQYDRPEYSYQGTLNTSNFPNLGEGIRPIAGLGNFSRNPVLSQDIYPHPTISPLMNSGRRDLYSMVGSYTSIDSERVFGDYGGGPEIGAVESDGTLPPSTKLYVNDSAASSGDGFTWGTAFKTLPEAFAVPLSQGAEIWVAPGTYYVTSNNNRSDKLTLLRGVSLVGSLPVGANSASQSRPDLPAQLTTISGDLGAQNDPNDNSYTLITGTDFDYYSIVGNDELPRIIYGVRFTGSAGNAVELMAPVVIDSCTFDHNAGGRALTFLTPGNIEEGTSVTVKNSTFDSNTAGAIDCYTFNLDVFSSKFFNNSAPTGAGILKRAGRELTSLTVERSLFYGNTAGPGRGAAIDSQDWTLELYQNTFADNIVTPSASDTNNRGGAGVWWSPNSSGASAVSRVVMVNNIFSGNRVDQTPSITTMEFQQFGYSASQLAKYYSFTITGNNIEGLDTYATFTNAADNVDFDPFFIDKANHDFRLQPDSYLLNRGVISNSPTDKTTIIATRDIGAFESPSNSTLPVPLQPVIFTTLPPDDDGRVFTIQLQPGLTNTTNYVWQIRTPEGSGFIDIVEDTRFSGVNTDTLKLTNPGRDMNRSAFRVRFTANGTTSKLYSANHILNVLPGIIYVVPGGRGLKNGGSWANAYQFINDGCNNVVEGTQVWIAAGSYGTGRYQPGNTVINQNYLNIPAGVSLYGGFVGNETRLSDRPAFNVDTTPDSERTFLTNGDSNLQLINISGTSSVTNRIDRISLSGNGGASGRAIIANGAKIQFTDFRNGYQSLGITLIDTTATFTNSRFYLARGEALTVLRGSLSIANGSFANNGYRVGGISNYGALTASDTPVKITDTSFSNNYGINTSAITTYGSTSLDIQRSIFRGNAIFGENQGGGAILYTSYVPSRIANCVFDGNHSGRISVANNSGSAIRSPGSGLLTLLHCTIASNVVDRGSGSALEGNIALVNSIVWGNTHEITSNGGVTTPLSPAVSASVTVTNSYVQGRASLGFYEPFFKDVSASDYSLTYASPMRDLVLADDLNTGATDLAGNARKFAGGLTDLGAYEFSAAAPAAVPILSKPAAVTAFAENPASFTLVAVSTFTWEYLNGGNWIPINGHDGWSVTQNPVTVGGMAATAYTVSNTALPVAYVTTPLQLRARAVDNPDFSIPASLTVNARHVVFVKPSVISGADGLSWATAYPTISTALAASDAGTDLWITTGDYTEPSIPSKAYVRYYPGFAGNETLVTQRNAVTRPVNLVGAVSKLPYNPTDSRTAPANSHQITAAPSAAASYVERPVSFSATASSALIWQYSADSGTTWAPLTSLGGWTVTANTGTGLSVASLTAVTANLNNYRFRANVVATGEFSTAATLTAKPRHVIYVNAAAASGGNGLSWASAFKTVAAALAAADDGADLWIVKGTYSEPTLAVTAGTKLYSGFLGNETDLSQRNAVTNPVVVNGTASVLTFNTPGATDFIYQIASAPVSAAATIYEENPISFSATRTANTSATLTWQISANGTEWTSLVSGTNGWTVTVTGDTSTLAHDVANIITHNGKSLRVIVTATGEVSSAAPLTVVARTVLYVKSHLTGAADGTSWTTAFKTISAALAASNAGTDLWIARGDYTEPTIPNVPLVRYYPGFAGLVSETSVTARNTTTNPVRLIGAASFLPYAPANIRTAPANLHQITAAPASAAPYVERAITFSSTSSQPLVWQYSTAAAPTTWATLSSLGAFNITTESVTGTTVASLGVVTANLNGLQLQTAITATGETSFSATLTATPRVILRVDSRVSTSGDGLSWPSAFKTLIEALSIANDGTDIWVAAGTYAELQLNIPEGAHIYPGFAGTETSLAQRNVTTNAVLIKGTAGIVNFSGSSAITTLRYNIVTAPRETAPYIANPVTFSATRASWSTAQLFWEYSTNAGATWQTAVGLADWTIATVGATTTISHPAAPTSMDGWLFRVVAPGVNEVSSEAKLIVKARITRYLNGAVSASGNGTTWATAYKTLTEALAHTDNGTDLWIAAGDYTEPTHAFVSGAAIYGGFIGTETALTQRNVTANVVTLRSTGGSIFTTNLATLGSLSGATYLDGVTLALGTNPNGQPALSLTGTTPYFANVTFTGHAQAVVATGGILIDMENCRFISNTTALTATGGSLVLDDCIFTNNVDGIVATLSCSLSIDGGAFTGNTGAAIRLGTDNNSVIQPSATLNDVTFSTNAIGIWAYAGNVTLTDCDFDHHTDTTIYAKSACTLTITNGTFTDNMSDTDGAAIRLVASSSSATGKSPTLSATGTTFTNNSAQNGGAIDAFTAKSVITLTGVTFNGNTALSSGNTTTSGGGAIRVRENPAFVVTGSTFTGNSGKYGGAIIAYQSTSATIASSMFTGNSASNYGIVSSDSVKLLTVTDTTFKNSSGAPALLHSGDYTANSTANITRSVFTGNLAGALSVFATATNVRETLFADNRGRTIVSGLKSRTSFAHVTIANNVANDNDSAITTNSDGTANDGGSLTIVNSILWNNTNATPPSLDQYFPIEKRQINITDTNRQRLYANTVIMGLSTISGTNLSSANPHFIDAANGNYRLSAYSNAIDKGSSAYVLTGETDLAGNARNQVTAPDLGAYESASAAALVPSFTLPTNYSASLDGTVSLTQPPTAGYTTTWQYNDIAGWHDFTVTTSSGYARSIAIDPITGTITFTGLKSGINWIRAVVTNGYDTYYSPDLRVNIAAFSVIYVDASVANSGNGTAWSTAVKTLTEAFALVDGDRRVIWIAKGNYPTAVSYKIPQGVEVYGGFPVGGSTFANRSTSTQSAVLSGGDTEVVRFIAGNTTLSQSVLDGVSVTGGQIGVLVDSFSPTLRNVVISGNTATGLVLRSSNALVETSTIDSNTGIDGGGIAVLGGSGTPTFRRLFVRGNTAVRGGGVYSASGSNFYIWSSLISGNLAARGAGFYVGSYPTAEQVTIASNRATTTGSAIHVDGGSRIVLRNSIVWNNGTLTAALTTDNSNFDSAYLLDFNAGQDATVDYYSQLTYNPYFPSPASPADAPTTAGVYTVPTFSQTRDRGTYINSNNGALDLAGQPRVSFGSPDLGAYEGTDAIATPYRVTSSPTAATFRRDGVGNTFTASATNATGYEWQIAGPDGVWVSLVDNAAFSGARSSTLTVLNASYSLNGYRIRAVINGPGGLLYTAAATLTVYPNRYYVKSGATAGGNGDSWATAFTSLQAALTAIPYDTSGTEIWVSAGTYTSTANTLSLRPGQLVYGGFAGTESSLAERNLAANVTRIVAAANSARTFNLVGNGTTGFNFRLDGLTIDATTAQTGTAIYNESTRDLVLEHVTVVRHERSLYQAAAANTTDTVGSLTVRYSEFRGNGNANIDANFQVVGGSTLIENSLFSGNRARLFAAAYIDAPTVLRHITVAGNRGYTAFYITDVSTETYNSVFWGNRYEGAAVTSILPLYRETGLNNIVEGYAPALFNVLETDIETNRDLDPGFVSPVAATSAPTITGDYRLLATSAAIDNGDDTETGTSSTDLAGSPRVSSVHVDSGAYEYQDTDLYRIAKQPVDSSAVSSPAIFNVVVAPLTASYVWEESTDNGASFTPITAATTPSLTVAGSVENHGRLYRVQVQFATGPLLVSNVVTLTSIKATVSADIPGGYGTPRVYNASANFAPDSWQWEVTSDGTTFTDVSGETAATLSVLGDSSYANRSYRARAIYSGGVSANSNAVAFAFADVPVVPGTATSSIASNLSFNVTGGVQSSTLTDAAISVHAGLSGRLTLADFEAPLISGDNVTLNFSPAPHAGERIQVTTTSSLARTDGLGIRPQVWEFRAPVISGVGAFSAPVAISTSAATAFALGDLNADGTVDALVATASGLQVFSNNGSATFTASGSTFGSSASAIVLGSLTSSGALDAVVINGSGDVQLWANNGTGTFILTQTLAGLGAQAIALGDVNADGDLDLVIGTATGARVLLNDGSGNFTLASTFGSGAVKALAIGDLDQDGDLDVVTTGETGTTVWSNNGSAVYTAATTVSDNFDRVALADLDADGRLDVVLVRTGAPAVLWHNTGNATFTTLVAAPGGGVSTTLATGDIDGDGKIDLVLTDAAGRSGAWLTSAGLASTRYADQPYFTLGDAAELADLDGDGALDLFALDRAGIPMVASYHLIGVTGNEDTQFGPVLGGFVPTPFYDSIDITVLPAHGTLFLYGQPLVNRNQYGSYGSFNKSALATLAYRPNANFTGLDSFGWRNSLNDSTHTYWISVSNVVDDIVAVADSITTLEGDSINTLSDGSINVLANDLNPDPGALVASLVTGPVHGTVTLSANGLFNYVHDGSATTSDSFTYLATNSTTGHSSSATVTIGITRHNVTPALLTFTAASGTHYTGQPAGDTVGTLSATDTDVLDTGNLVYSLVSGDGSANNAEFTITGSSLNTASPIDATNGLTRSVRIRVTDTLGTYSEQTFTFAFTQAPTALAISITTIEDNVIPITLSGIGGIDALSYEITGSPAHGTLSPSTLTAAANSYDYTPNANFNGTDTFTFRVTDSALVSTNATVTITVNSVEDLPTLATVSPITINEDNSTTFTLNGYDGDGDTLTYQLVNAAAFGTVQINGADVTYTPNANANGVETLTFTVSDGVNVSDPIEVTINVTAVNDAPVIGTIAARSVTRNQSDSFTAVVTDIENSATTLRVGSPAQHGVVTITDHTVQYVPTTGFTGADNFTLIANDGELDSAPVAVSVAIAPIATEQVELTVYRGLFESTSIPAYTGVGEWSNVVPANLSTPAHGTVAVVGSTILYTHDGSEPPVDQLSDTDTFTYTVTNATDDIRTITVTVTIKDHVLLVTNGNDTGAGSLRNALDTVRRFSTETLTPAKTTTADWSVLINIAPDFLGNRALIARTYDWSGPPAQFDHTSPNDFPSAYRIMGKVTIDAAASPGLLLLIQQDFQYYARSFYVPAGSSLTLKNLEIRGSRANRDGFRDSLGGAIRNLGNFAAENVTFRSNIANVGSAIYNDGGTVSLTDCSFIDNNVEPYNPTLGGVIYSRNGTVNLTGVTFSDPVNPELYIEANGASGVATINVVDSTIPTFVLVSHNGGTFASNGLPRAVDDALIYPVGQAFTIDIATLLTNDIGTPAVSAIADATSTKGVTITRTGNNLVYQAPTGITDNDTFTYTVTDAAGLKSTATVTLTFQNPLGAPEGNADTASVYRGLYSSIDVLANDVDPRSEPLTVAAVNPAAHGSTAIVNNRVLYTHNNDSATSDTFTYSVSNATGTMTNVTVNVAINDRVILATNGADSGNGTLRAALAITEGFGLTTLTHTNIRPDWKIQIVTGDSGWTTTGSINDDSTTSRAAFKITTNVMIEGPWARSFDVDGNETGSLFTLTPSSSGGSTSPLRLFTVAGGESGGSLTLKNIKLVGFGGPQGQGGGMGPPGPSVVFYGGGVLNRGTFVADNVDFVSFWGSRGAAFYNDGGTASLTECRFTNNYVQSTSGSPEGIVTSFNGTITLTRNILADDYANPEVYIAGSGSGGNAVVNFATDPSPEAPPEGYKYGFSYRFEYYSNGTVTVLGLPILADDSLDRPRGKTFKILLATLLANDTGTEGATITFANSQHGYAIARSGTFLVYKAPAAFNDNDQFTYTVTTPGGSSRTATVYLNVIDPPDTATVADTTMKIDEFESGRFTLRIIGVPGRKYMIQRCDDFATSGNWYDYHEAYADAQGLVLYTDPQPFYWDPMGSAQGRFYRAVYNK